MPQMQPWMFCVQTPSSHLKSWTWLCVSIISALGGKERWTPRAWWPVGQPVKMVSFKMVVFRRDLVTRQYSCNRRHVSTHLYTTHVMHTCKCMLYTQSNSDAPLLLKIFIPIIKLTSHFRGMLAGILLTAWFKYAKSMSPHCRRTKAVCSYFCSTTLALVIIIPLFYRHVFLFT